MEAQNGNINVLVKYGIDPVTIITDPTKGLKSAIKIALEVRSRIESYASGRIASFDEINKQISNDQLSPSWFKAKEVFEDITALIVESGVLNDSKAVVHLSNFLTGFSKNTLPGIVDHNFSRQKNLAKPEIESKKTLQSDYSSLREGIFAIAGLVGHKVDKSTLPPYTGNMSDAVPVTVQESRFYQFKFTVNMEGVEHKFEAGTNWWEIAQELGCHPMANSWKIADFMEWIEKTYDFDFNDSATLIADSGTEILYGWNLTITKV